MSAMTLCDTCIGICVDGTFDVCKMQQEPVFFDGFSLKATSSKTQCPGMCPTATQTNFAGHVLESKIDFFNEEQVTEGNAELSNSNTVRTNAICRHCRRPATNVTEDDVCPHCEHPDAFTVSYSLDRDLEQEFGQGKQLHVIAICDDCLSCT